MFCVQGDTLLINIIYESKRLVLISSRPEVRSVWQVRSYPLFRPFHRAISQAEMEAGIASILLENIDIMVARKHLKAGESIPCQKRAIPKKKRTTTALVCRVLPAYP